MAHSFLCLETCGYINNVNSLNIILIGFCSKNAVLTLIKVNKM